MSAVTHQNRLLLLILGLIAVFWGVAGWLDLGEQSQAGFATDSNWVVTDIDQTLPAGATTMEIGDVIVEVDDIPVENTARIARLPRVEQGKRRSFSVDKNDERRIYNIYYVGLDQQQVSFGRARILIGWLFALLPLAAWFTRPCRQTELLVLMGIGLSFAFTGGPYIGTFSIRSVVEAIVQLFILTGLATVLWYLLNFPNRRPFARRSWSRPLVYLPALLLWLLIAWKTMFTPPPSGFVNGSINIMLGVVLGGYILFSLITLLRGFAAAEAEQRKALSLRWMVWGTILALIPLTVRQVTGIFSPLAELPGSDYYFVLLALIPMTWALSASRQPEGVESNS